MRARMRRPVIVSHRHRFIFLAVPRTGTHAVRAALGPLLGDDDWQQQSLTVEMWLPVPALARIGHGHLTLRQLQENVSRRIWGDYFKFGFVRNPYDRFVSVCAMLNKRNPGYPGNETAFMKRALQVRRFRQRVLVRPQVEMLVDDKGELGMDFIGRYETLEQSFAEACRRIGVRAADLTQRNASAHGAYATYYDDELLALVTDFYHRDFEELNYDVAATAEALPCA